MVVLVNRSSASAAEIVKGAYKIMICVFILGETTFGIAWCRPSCRLAITLQWF